MAFNNAVDASTPGIQSITSGGVWNGRTITAGNGITVTNGDGTAGNPTIAAISPFSSLFFAYVSVNIPNVTGDGTLYTIVWDSTDANLGTNYNTATGIYTAPATGYYVFHASALIDTLAATSTDGKFRFRVNSTQIGSSERGNYFNQATPSGFLHHSISCMFPLNINDTVEVMVQVGGGTKTVGISAASPVRASSFEGYRIG